MVPLPPKRCHPRGPVLGLPPPPQMLFRERMSSLQSDKHRRSLEKQTTTCVRGKSSLPLPAQGCLRGAFPSQIGRLLPGARRFELEQGAWRQDRSEDVLPAKVAAPKWGLVARSAHRPEFGSGCPPDPVCDGQGRRELVHPLTLAVRPSEGEPGPPQRAVTSLESPAALTARCPGILPPSASRPHPPLHAHPPPPSRGPPS